jgi:hypothetical protein
LTIPDRADASLGMEATNRGIATIAAIILFMIFSLTQLLTIQPVFDLIAMNLSRLIH